MLHTLYVLEAAEPPSWFDVPTLEPEVDTKTGEALHGVVTEASTTGLKTDVVTAVVRGETAPTIIEYAPDHDIDLLLLGTHGRTGLDRLAMGSIAEYVVRESPVPVVTVQAMG